MDTSGLLTRLSECTGNDLSHSRRNLEAFVKALRQYTCEGNEVAIPGFGTFSPKKISEWVNVDEVTGKRTLMPPSVNITFKSSIVLRKKLIG